MSLAHKKENVQYKGNQDAQRVAHQGAKDKDARSVEKLNTADLEHNDFEQPGQEYREKGGPGGILKRNSEPHRVQGPPGKSLI